MASKTALHSQSAAWPLPLLFQSLSISSCVSALPRAWLGSVARQSIEQPSISRNTQPFVPGCPVSVSQLLRAVFSLYHRFAPPPVYEQERRCLITVQLITSQFQISLFKFEKASRARAAEAGTAQWHSSFQQRAAALQPRSSNSALRRNRREGKRQRIVEKQEALERRKLRHLVGKKTIIMSTST